VLRKRTPFKELKNDGNNPEHRIRRTNKEPLIRRQRKRDKTTVGFIKSFEGDYGVRMGSESKHRGTKQTILSLKSRKGQNSELI